MKITVEVTDWPTMTAEEVSARRNDLLAAAPELLGALRLLRHSILPDMSLAMSDAAKEGVLRHVDSVLSKVEGRE